MWGLCDTALGAYDAEQTNRLSDCFGERGSRQMSRPWLTGGSVHPCTLPRVSRVGRLNG